MAYGNNNYYRRSYGGYGGGYGGGYSRSSYGRSYGGGGSYRRAYGSYSRQKKKHSGCKMRSGWTTKSGEHVNENMITGWNYSRRLGLISFIASPRKEGRETKNDRIERWVVNIRFRDGPKIFTGFYNLDHRKLRIPDLRMTANPHAPNGGYFGTSNVSKR